MEVTLILTAICILVILAFVFRGIGAWMFRIDEVIKSNKEIVNSNNRILTQLKEMSNET